MRLPVGDQGHLAVASIRRYGIARAGSRWFTVGWSLVKRSPGAVEDPGSLGLVAAVGRATPNDNCGVHQLASQPTSTLGCEHGTERVVRVTLADPGLRVEPVVNDPRRALRILPWPPPRDSLCPTRNRGTVSREPDRDLDPIVSDLDQERITEDPEPVVTRQNRLAGDSLHPVDSIEALWLVSDDSPAGFLALRVSSPRGWLGSAAGSARLA
jgi:hypothetical protein